MESLLDVIIELVLHGHVVPQNVVGSCRDLVPPGRVSLPDFCARTLSRQLLVPLVEKEPGKHRAQN